MSATAAATLEAQRTELVSRIETAARAALGMPACSAARLIGMPLSPSSMPA